MIRQIASSLPLKPVPRLHFTIVDPELDSSSECGSKSISFQGLASIPILDHQQKIELWKYVVVIALKFFMISKLSIIIFNHRIKMKQKSSPNTATITDLEDDTEDEEIQSLRSPTPPSVCADSLYSSQSTVDTLAMNKITTLEDELSRLREQIAKIFSGTANQQTSGNFAIIHENTFYESI